MYRHNTLCVIKPVQNAVPLWHDVAKHSEQGAGGRGQKGQLRLAARSAVKLLITC